MRRILSLGIATGFLSTFFGCAQVDRLVAKNPLTEESDWSNSGPHRSFGSWRNFQQSDVSQEQLEVHRIEDPDWSNSEPRRFFGGGSNRQPSNLSYERLAGSIGP